MTSFACFGLSFLLGVGSFTPAYALQSTTDAVPDADSNRIAWREGAPGASVHIESGGELKDIRYRGKSIRCFLRLWASDLLAFVSVWNGTNDSIVIDTAHDISVQLALPRRDSLFPLRTEEYARLIVKQNGSKQNKEIAKNIRSKPWTLGPVTIAGKNNEWAQVFYFSFRERFDDRLAALVPHVDLVVYLDGMAFVFPFKL